MKNILRLSVLSMAVALIASCTNPQNSSTKQEASTLKGGVGNKVRAEKPLLIDASHLNNYTYSIVLDTVINGDDTLISFALQVVDVSQLNVDPDGTGNFDRTVNNMLTVSDNVLIKTEDPMTVSVSSSVDDQKVLGKESLKYIKIPANGAISTRNGYVVSVNGDSIPLNKIGWISHQGDGQDITIGYSDEETKLGSSRPK